MRTAIIKLEDIKSEGWQELSWDLFGQDDNDDDVLDEMQERISAIFQYGEYGNLEIEVDENLNIVGGRIIPYKPSIIN